MGLFEETPYVQVTLRVPPGSCWSPLATALTEATNVYGEEFGIKRLKEEVLRHRDLPARRLAEDLIAAAHRWSGDVRAGRRCDRGRCPHELNASVS